MRAAAGLRTTSAQGSYLGKSSEWRGRPLAQQGQPGRRAGRGANLCPPRCFVHESLRGLVLHKDPRHACLQAALMWLQQCPQVHRGLGADAGLSIPLFLGLVVAHLCGKAQRGGEKPWA